MRKPNILLILFMMFMFLLFQVSQAFACDTWPWLDYPKKISLGHGHTGEYEHGLYELVPGVRIYTPVASMQCRQDVFRPGLPLTAELREAAEKLEAAQGDRQLLGKAQDVFCRLSDKMGKDYVQGFTRGLRIYLVPEMSYADERAAKAGGVKVDGHFFYNKKEIWVDVSSPGWPNILLHELGHAFERDHFEIAGENLIFELYPDQYHATTILRYFNTLPWLDDPNEWFAEAFIVLFGYPDLPKYPPLNVYDERCPGAVVEIMRGAEFVDNFFEKEGENSDR